MKTVIFNGSPRKNGESAKVINRLKEGLKGEVRVFSPYFMNVKPCVDCRWCMKNDECSIKDDMTGIYEEILEADNIVIVSPIYFSTLTGEILNLFSRLQLFFVSRFFNKSDRYKTKGKYGGIILVAGGSTKDFSGAENTARIVLREMNGEVGRVIVLTDTDKVGFEENEGVGREIGEMVEEMNRRKP